MRILIENQIDILILKRYKMKINDLIRLTKNYELKIKFAKDLNDDPNYNSNIHDFHIISKDNFEIYFSAELSNNFSELIYGPCLTLKMGKSLDYEDLLADDSFLNLWTSLIPIFDNRESYKEK